MGAVTEHGVLIRAMAGEGSVCMYVRPLCSCSVQRAASVAREARMRALVCLGFERQAEAGAFFLILPCHLISSVVVINRASFVGNRNGAKA